MSLELTHVEHHGSTVVLTKRGFETVSGWIDERIQADGDLRAEERNDPGSVNLLHNVLIDDRPTAVDREAALAFASMVKRFTSKRPGPTGGHCGPGDRGRNPLPRQRTRGPLPHAGLTAGDPETIKCGNCHSEIDWNAIQQCLCSRGPVIRIPGRGQSGPCKLTARVPPRPERARCREADPRGTTRARANCDRDAHGGPRDDIHAALETIART